MGRIVKYKGIEPEIARGVFLAEGSILIGDVKIGNNSNVWFNTVIRGDLNSIRIGENVSVQDLVLIHVSRNGPPAIIGDNVTIGHKATVHGAKISNNVLVGMGAILLDGCEIGEYSVIGAGSVVTEGMKIPPYTLVVGIPAKVKKTFDKSEVERFSHFYKEYLGLKEEYLKMEGK